MPFLTFSTAALALLSGAAFEDHGFEREANFPDTAAGEHVLLVDLHTHSVFSDGMVWPTIRVEEALRDGIDAIAQTEHLEHQPKREDIPHPDRNRSHAIAAAEVERLDADLMAINGAEITRSMPPGHVNAVFVTDANALLVPDAAEAIRIANRQGAFVFWNHPNWLPQAPDGVARIFPFHEELIAEGMLHGVEVANGTLDAYSEHAFQIAIDHNLTVLGTSDIHGLVDWTHDAAHGDHRPMTMVLTRDHTPQALREALFAGRTMAWAHDDIIGHQSNVEPVVQACLKLEPKGYLPGASVLDLELVNACPVNFTLNNEGARTIHNISDLIRVERYSSTRLHVRMNDERAELALEVDVLNAHIRPRVALRTTLRAAIPQGMVPDLPAGN
jgi:3',5'-nucleoside bisphosphate phosphatase